MNADVTLPLCYLSCVSKSEVVEFQFFFFCSIRELSLGLRREKITNELVKSISIGERMSITQSSPASPA